LADNVAWVARAYNLAWRPSATCCERTGKRAESFDAELFRAPGRFDLRCLQKGQRVAPERFEARAKHLAPLAEGSSDHAFKSAWVRLGKGRCSRQEFNHGRCNGRRRRKGSPIDIKENARPGAPLSENGKSAVCFSTGGSNDTFRNFPLEHERQAVEPCRPWFGLQPADEKRRCYIVWQVRDNPGWAGDQSFHVGRQRIAFHNGKAPRICFGNLAERRNATMVPLNRDNPSGTRIQQCARQTARSRANLNYVMIVEGSRRTGDPSRKVEVEQEVLSQRLVRSEAMAGNDFP
jgi:hypothetical protein